MFKAWDAHATKFVISLDYPGDLLDVLRARGRSWALVCPTCKQPVGVRAGPTYRTHFAHRHLGDCAAQNEPESLREARGVLYDWLKVRFSEDVTLEHVPEGWVLPRPFDCWVERREGSVGYWIVHANMKPDAREATLEFVRQAKCHIHFLLLAPMMRRNDALAHELNLTPTERSLSTQTNYDRSYPYSRGSLRYLNPEQASLHTFRGLQLVEDPQRYRGTELVHPLAEVRFRPSTGEFVHPGEQERIDEWDRAELEKVSRHAEHQRRLAEAERVARARLLSPPVPPLTPRDRAAALYQPTPQRRPYAASVVSQEAGPPLEDLLPCDMCGVSTRDWPMKHGNGKCTCRPCLKKKYP